MFWKSKKNNRKNKITDPKESVFFISLHKCATVFFSSYVLKKVRGFNHVDYEVMIFRNQEPQQIIFEKSGYIYGVLRLNFTQPVYDKLISKVVEKEFLTDKKIIFLIRDPKDILVSQYYSFGFSHGLSANQEIKEKQLKAKQEIASWTIDEYILEKIGDLKRRLNLMVKLVKENNHHILLKYEDLILNYEKFYGELAQFIPVEEEVKEQLYAQTRPREMEMIHEHKRSGKVGGYQSKLKPATIDEIKRILKEPLHFFGYDE